jgi:hypothetical protein
MVKSQKRNKAIRAVVAAALAPTVRKAKRRVKRRLPSTKAIFGPITTIDTAPVSIGNTFQGVKPVLTPVEDGVRVRGRDYFINLDTVSAGFTNWLLVGGAPITPACMVASAIKGLSNSYAQYKVHGVSFHFITAAPTSDAGSIMLYVSKDRIGPGPISSSPNFLPFVLSDHNTCISPLWKNCTTTYIPNYEWMSTDVLLDEDLRHQSVGELLVYTKSSALISPGYILMDYDITFREMQSNPRLLTLPVARMKYTQIALFRGATTLGSPAIFNFSGSVLLDVITASLPPGGTLPGDIYKFIFDVTQSAFSGDTVANILAQNVFNSSGSISTVPLSITDGFTCYGIVTSDGGNVLLTGSFPAAVSEAVTLVFGATNALNVTTLRGYCSLVGSMANPAVLQASF